MLIASGQPRSADAEARRRKPERGQEGGYGEKKSKLAWRNKMRDVGPGRTNKESELSRLRDEEQGSGSGSVH